MVTDVSFGAIPAFTNATAYVQGPGDMLYIATKAGQVLGWNELTQTFTVSFTVGKPLSSIDISPDGTTLMVGESAATTPNSTAPTAIDLITLANGSVKQMQLNWLTSYEQGVSAVAYDSAGDALIATDFEGSGWTPLHFVPAGSQVIGADTVSGPTSYFFSSEIRGGSYLFSSSDHRYVLVMEDNISNGPLDLYDTQAGKIIVSKSFSTYNSGKGDINDRANLILDITYNDISVLDMSLTQVKDLGSLQHYGTIGGGHFDLNGNYLFLWNPGSGHILVYSTQTWQLDASINAFAYNGVVANDQPIGNMFLSQDGRFLTLNTGSGFENIDLSTQLSLHLTGDGSGSAIYGSAGSDVFTAGAGPNTFVGEGGSDTVIFSGTYASYKINTLGNGSETVVSGSTTVTLTGIQNIQFQDVTVEVSTQGAQSFLTSAATASSWAAAGGPVGVADTAANVSAHLDSLQSLASAGKLSSITLTDAGIPALSLTPAQFAADSQALADIGGNYVLAVTLPDAGTAFTAPQNHGTTVTLSGNASQYTINAAGDGENVVVLSAGPGSTDTLTNVTAIQFADHTDIVAQAPVSGAVTTGNVVELYAAVLAREPDVAGLAYYENALQANPNIPLTTFAQWFLAAPEYTTNAAHAYAQTTAGETQFIIDAYANLLHRAPESGAISFYLSIIQQFTNGLNAGTSAYAAADSLAHATMLADFSQAPEFLADVTVTAQSPTSAQHWLVLT